MPVNLLCVFLVVDKLRTDNMECKLSFSIYTYNLYFASTIFTMFYGIRSHLSLSQTLMFYFVVIVNSGMYYFVF